MRRYYLEILVSFFLIAATFIVFRNTLAFEFVNFDDNIYVTENTQVKAGLTSKSIIWAFTSIHAGYWIPLVWISYMLDIELFGLNSHGFHFVNLLFHLVNTVLLFWVFRRMTGALWQSAFVAAIFALHPLHVESVAWITERKDVLSAFFWFLSMIAYHRYTKDPGMRTYFVVVLFFILGLMAKPMIVTLPFVLLLLDFWPLARFQFPNLRGPDQTKANWKLLWEKMPLFGVALVFSALGYVTQQKSGAIVSLGTVSFGHRIANALVSYVKYFWKTVWPFDLVVFYPFPAHGLPGWQVAGASLALISISVSAILAARRYLYIPVGWFWFLGTLIPVIGLAQGGRHAMADRFMYIPLIGLSIIVAWGITDLAAKLRGKNILLSLSSGAIILVLMKYTWLQVQHWENSITLYEHTLKVAKNDFSIHYNMGLALAKKGDLKKAISHFSEAIRIRPHSFKGHNNIGFIYQKTRQWDKAIAHYKKALTYEPRQVDTLHNLGFVYKKKGQLDLSIMHFKEALTLDNHFEKSYNSLGILYLETKQINKAIAYFNRAIEINPNNFETLNNLGYLYLEMGQLVLAENYLNKTLSLNINYEKSYFNLGILYTQKNQQEKAIEYFKKAIQLKPNLADTYVRLGDLLLRQNQLDEAEKAFHTAIELNQSYTEAHLKLGVVYGKKGQYDRAIAEFKRIIEINRRHPAAHYNLGLSYERKGIFKKAMGHYKRALELKPDYLLAKKQLENIEKRIE